ncbi:MAG TPA: shikimate kinase, partial [Bacteroidia bacterium]|nr:shikimate kinase [Bacteroidia bacterium]
MKFFLIGFMGAGKTTIGKYAAHHNGMHFLDMDEYIEKK